MYKEIITWLTADIWNTYCDCSSTKTLWESIQQAAEGWQFKEQAIFLKIQICAFFFFPPIDFFSKYQIPIS